MRESTERKSRSEDGEAMGSNFLQQEQQTNVNAGVIRVLNGVVNAVDAERCEVDDSLLDLLLQLKKIGSEVGTTSSSRSICSSQSIWRYTSVRRVPVTPCPWPEVCMPQCIPSDAPFDVDLEQVGGAAAVRSIASALAAEGVCTCVGLLPASMAAAARSELANAATRSLFKPALRGGGQCGATPRDDVVLWLDPVAHPEHRKSLPTLLAVEEKLAQLGAALSGGELRAGVNDVVHLRSRSGAMAACYHGTGAQYRPHIDNPFELEASGCVGTYVRF